MIRTAIVTEWEWAASHTKRFRVQVEGSGEFRFRPGQYVLVSAEGAPAGKSGAYSIASPPRSGNRLELCLNRVEGANSFSQFLFELSVGARLKLEGPFGDFTLRDPVRDSLFVATGTGLAPIRSMIQSLAECGCPAELTFLFGVRDESSILFRAEFEELARRLPAFRFVPTLSRPGEHWKGTTGYVQEHILRLLAGRRGVDVYICGLKAMVDEVRGQLQASGHDAGAVFYEKYD